MRLMRRGFLSEDGSADERPGLWAEVVVFPLPPPRTAQKTWGFPKLGVPSVGPYDLGILLFEDLYNGSLIDVKPRIVYHLDTPFKPG